MVGNDANELSREITPEAVRPLLRTQLPFLLLDKQGRVLECNEAAQTLLPAPTVDRDVASVIDIPHHVLKNAADGTAGPVTGLVQSINAGPMPILAQPLRLARGGELLVLLSDLNAFHAAEEARFERMPTGILRLDTAGRIRFLNSPVRRIWGDDDILGLEFAKLFGAQTAADIRRLVTEVLATNSSRILRIPEGFPGMLETPGLACEPRLTLVPYFAPGNRVVGVVVQVRQFVAERLRLALREAAASVSTGAPGSADWQRRLRRMLELVHGVVPYDRAVLTLLSPDGEWARPILVHPDPDPAWPPVWSMILPPQRDRMMNGRPFRVDLEQLLKDQPRYRSDPLVLRTLADGMCSHAVFPLPSEQPEAFLVMSSTRPGYFGHDADPAEPNLPSEEDRRDPDALDDDGDSLPRQPFRALQVLELEAPLLSILRQVARERAAALQLMTDSVADADNVIEAAKILLGNLVSHFAWDHASIFVVERHGDGGQFRLYAQYPECEPDGTPHMLSIRSNFTQPLYVPDPSARFDCERARRSGMLSATVRAQMPLAVQNRHIRDMNGEAPHFFVATAEAQVSALTVPVMLDGRIRWVVDVLSRHENAFIESDAAPIGRLVQQLMRRVADLRSARLNDMLIRLIEQGVVVTDSAGVILSANPRARDMLGLPSGELPSERLLSEHVGCTCKPDAAVGSPLPTENGTENCVRLGPIGGVCSPFRVRRIEDRTAMRDVVWLLDGNDLQEWTYDRRYIEETVQEVARQVRGPLLLASSIASKLARVVQGAPGPLANRLRAEIGKADITFERLAETIGAKREPKRDEKVIDLGQTLEQVVAALPGEDKDLIDLDAGKGASTVGDRERLCFVVRSLIGHMLVQATGRLRIELRPDAVSGSWLSLHADGLAAAAPAADGLAELAREARDKAGAGLGTAERVLGAHGGRLEQRADGYRIWLPSTTRGARP